MATIIDRLITVLGFDTDLRGLARYEQSAERVQKRLDGIGKTTIKVGGALSIIGGLAVAAFTGAAKASINWESDFAGVRKTVDGTDEELAAINAELRRMSRDDIPLPVGELAGVAEAAGQLGIETASVTSFTAVMAKLGVTTNLSAQDAATSLARLANVTGMNQSLFDRLGATVVWLGNNYATTEAEIVSFGLRLAGTGSLIGLNENQILAFGTALSSLGINAEAGGSAVSRVWADMQKAVQAGGPELDIFAEVSGLSGAGFAQLFEEDAAAATLAFISGLNRMIEAGEPVHGVLEELGFDSIRIRDTLLRAAGAPELFASALDGASVAWEENLALEREAELRFATLASDLVFLRNKVMDLAISVGNALTPSISRALGRIKPVIDAANDWAAANPVLVQRLAILSGVILILGLALIALGTAFQIAAFAVGGYVAAVKLAIFFHKVYHNILLVTRIRLWLLTLQTGISTGAQWLWNTAVAASVGIVRGAAFVWAIAKAAMLAGATATGVATAAQWALNVAMTANPVGLLIVGIGLLIAALAAGAYYAWQYRDAIVGFFEGLWEQFNQLPLWAQVLIAFFAGPVGFVLLLIARLGDLSDALVAIRDFIMGIDFSEAGTAWMRTLAAGILGGLGTVKDAVGSVLGKARALLPFSDAREGPLSGLTESGQSLPETIAAGIRQRRGDIGAALASVMPPNGLTALPVGPSPVGAGTGGGTTNTFQFTGGIHVTSTSPEKIPEDTGEKVRDQLRSVVEEWDSLEAG